MNHKEFEMAKLAIKADLFRIKNESGGAKEPPGSFSAQLDVFKSMKAVTEAKQKNIKTNAQNCIGRQEVGTDVILPMDMPVMPATCKGLAAKHSDDGSKVKECREAHDSEWRERENRWKSQWDKMFDKRMERDVSWQAENI